MNKLPHLILIIDDDETILEATKIAVETAGYIVQTLSDANLAIPTIIKVKPKLLIIDMLLSGKDGGEIIKQLRKEKKIKEISVIMLSAHPNAEVLAKESGADDFLAKPFEIDDLLNKISNNLHRK